MLRQALRWVRLLWLVAAVAGCGGSGSSPGTVRVGVILPTSSGVAAAAASALRGVEMAADEVNAERRLRLILVIHDDRGSPQKAIELFQKLSADPGVAAVIGGLTDAVAVQLSAVASAAQTPLLSPGATGPIPFSGQYFFRTSLPASMQGKALAEYALGKGLRQASVVQDSNEYGTAVAEGFSQAMRAGGGVVLSQHLFSDGTRDFSSVVQALLRERPDTVLFAGYPDEGVIFVRQLARAGVESPLLAPDSLASPEFASAVPSRGIVVATAFFPESPLPRVRSFVREFRNRYGQLPDAYAAQSYDAAKLLVVAVKRVGPGIHQSGGRVDRAKLRDALASIQDYPGVTGTITFDRMGNPARDVQLLRAEGGRLIVLP